MEGVNDYWRQLSPDEIAARKHRDFIGGLWEELGSMQFEFMRSQGLLPHHVLLDVGCGALRGGLFFVRYLDTGNYCGLDINASLVEAGRREIADASLLGKSPRLLVNENFEASIFGTQFDFALAQSVFTHLYMNHILRCLREVRRVLAPGGRFFATFFEAPDSVHTSPIQHTPGDVTTFYDRNPFHHSLEEIELLSGLAGMIPDYIGDWGHPRGQKMVCFVRGGAS